MSYEKDSASLTFTDYAELVASTRRPDPITNIGELMHDEFWELLQQHDDAFSLLYAVQVGLYDIDRHSPAAELAIDGLVEEIGDQWWFGTTEASEQGETIESLCNQTLQRWAGNQRAITPVGTIESLETAVAELAPGMRVARKAGLLAADGPQEADFASLNESPHYLLMRTGMRVMRAYEQSQPIPPFTASDLEAVMDKTAALGDFLCVLAYVGSSCLKRSLGEILLSNIVKLHERAAWGKPPELIS